MKNIKAIYSWVITELSIHKKVPLFLSHGGIHLIVLIILGIIAVWMFTQLRKSSITSFNQLSYTFYGDTLHNYRLNHLVYEKDLRKNKGWGLFTNSSKDILSYGFEKVVDDKEKKIINSISIIRKDSSKEVLEDGTKFDLVSVVRYVSNNSNKKNPDQAFRFYPRMNISTQRYVVLSYPNREKYYYSYSTLQDDSHIFNKKHYSEDNLIKWDNINPLFSFWIGIDIKDRVYLDKESYIKIKFNDMVPDKAEEGIEEPLSIDKVIPAPTEWTISEIVYKGEQLANVISQHGIYVSGTDPIKKEKAEQRNLYFTVYLGTIIAFMLDIIVQLILKWRKLKKEKQQSPSKTEQLLLPNYYGNEREEL